MTAEARLDKLQRMDARVENAQLERECFVQKSKVDGFRERGSDSFACAGWVGLTRATWKEIARRERNLDFEA